MPSRARLTAAYLGIIYMPPSMIENARKNIGDWSDEHLAEKFKSAAANRRRAKDWVANFDKNHSTNYNCDI